jgi:hypothetical protein
VRAHRVGQFDAHVAEAAKPDDADLLAGAGVPVAQRRIGGDAGTQQRRHGLEMIHVADAQHEFLVDDDVGGIAAVGVLATERGPVVGAGEAVLAIILFTVLARVAVAATVDHAADADRVAGLEAFHVLADRGDGADDFVARHRRVLRVVPFVAYGVQVRVTHAAIEDVDGDIVRSGCATLDGMRGQRFVGGLRGVGGGLGHRYSPVDVHEIESVERSCKKPRTSSWCKRASMRFCSSSRRRPGSRSCCAETTGFTRRILRLACGPPSAFAPASCLHSPVAQV